MINRSTDVCPNCDSYIDSDYCYSCGYTVKNYNYLAELEFSRQAVQRMENSTKAQAAIKRMFRGVSISNNIVLLPKTYVDADRQEIRDKISKVRKQYDVKLTYVIQQERNW